MNILEVSNHVFSVDRLSIILTGLKENYYLQTLNLTNNMIDDQGACLIGFWLS